MKRLLALTIIAASFAVAGTAAAGIYTHKTSDPAYLAADGTILADPYGVGEGAGADVSAILYRGDYTTATTTTSSKRPAGRMPGRWLWSLSRSRASWIITVSTMTPPRSCSPKA